MSSRERTTALDLLITEGIIAYYENKRLEKKTTDYRVHVRINEDEYVPDDDHIISYFNNYYKMSHVTLSMLNRSIQRKILPNGDCLLSLIIHESHHSQNHTQ